MAIPPCADQHCRSGLKQAVQFLVCAQVVSVEREVEIVPAFRADVHDGRPAHEVSGRDVVDVGTAGVEVRRSVEMGADVLGQR